jgi:hypothetical protein
LKSKFLVIGLVLLSVVRPEARNSGLAKQQLSLASAFWTIPVMANTPGQFGAYFKTKVIVANPTTSSYTVYATLYNTNGKVNTIPIEMPAGQIRAWENFLEEAFHYGGAGAVEFDSEFEPPGGSADFKFFVTAEVYTDSSGGRYKTVVATGTSIESINSADATYNLGVSVDSNQRTNIGCFNSSSVENIIHADVYDISGILLDTITFNLKPNGWEQKGVSVAVTDGFIRWRPTQTAYAYAVVVDNSSNDGTFAPATAYVP